jgi:hypothetical protein
MAIVEAAPVTDVQGGLIALGCAVVLLLLRAWLTSPQRRFPRLVLLPPPPPLAEQLGAEEPGAGDDGEPHSEKVGNRMAGLAPAVRQVPARVRSTYDGRH